MSELSVAVNNGTRDEVAASRLQSHFIGFDLKGHKSRPGSQTDMHETFELKDFNIMGL